MRIGKAQASVVQSCVLNEEQNERRGGADDVGNGGRGLVGYSKAFQLAPSPGGRTKASERLAAQN